MSDLVAEILELYLDIKHRFKVRKRRKFEKENNLPKKRIISPMNKVLIAILIISTPIFFLRLNRIRNQGKNITTNKIIKISKILEAEKRQIGKYPASLKAIIRNNPLRQNITLDYWKNDFVYIISKDSLNYNIISLGKDQILDTSDDIKFTN